MTHIEAVKLHEKRTRTALLELLKMKEEELAELIFEGAYAYLEKVLGTDEYGLKHLPATSQFWAWWRKQWHDIDAIFIASVSRNGSGFLIRARDNEYYSDWCENTVEALRERYTYYHEAEINNKYLNNEIVRAGMHQMIKSLINQLKEETKAMVMDESRKEVVHV